MVTLCGGKCMDMKGDNLVAVTFCGANLRVSVFQPALYYTTWGADVRTSLCFSSVILRVHYGEFKPQLLHHRGLRVAQRFTDI